MLLITWVCLARLIRDDQADLAAQFGRRPDRITDARRMVADAARFWFPVVAELQRHVVAVSRIVVNHESRWATPLSGGRGEMNAKKHVRAVVCVAALPGWPGFGNPSSGSRFWC